MSTLKIATKVWASAFIIFLAGCDDTRQDSENPKGLKADQYVVLKSSAYGCQYPSKFAEAIEHHNRDELTAWAKIVTDVPYCFSANDFSPSQRWVVLQIRGSAMEIGFASASDYSRLAKVDNKFKWDQKFWTLAEWGNLYVDSSAELQEKSKADLASVKPEVAVPLTGKFIVQVAALATEDKVLELQGILTSSGIASYTQKAEIDGLVRTRVRVGPFSNKKQADTVRAKLSKIGLAGTIVPI